MTNSADALGREHDGCPYFAVIMESEELSQRYWFCNKCGWMEKIDDVLTPSDYIVVHWTEGDAQQSAAGYFCHYDRVCSARGICATWLVLDCGYGILTTADNFRWERAEPPEGETYIPIKDPDA